MYTLQMLCRDIALAPAVTERVLALEEACHFPTLPLLRQENTWEKGLAETAALLGDDPDGFGMLTCMLLCALECYEDFVKIGFSDKIYVDTMACFSRFVNEHLASFGRYGFDRGFWTVRQVSGKLFRIGQLEYELLTEQGRNAVSLHIPSDADLSLSALRASWEQAKPKIGNAFPEFADAPYVCGSWLLSQNLKDLLPEHSRILAFQRSFTLRSTWCDEDFKEWVYKRKDIPNDRLPENTTLQRNIKAFLLKGGAFLSGEGILVKDPFLP